MTQRDEHYYVYLAASRSCILYCGMTNNIEQRMEEHRAAAIPGFTATYRCNRLVWFERHRYVRNAIHREKQIKRWRREKKVALVEEDPTWDDLSANGDKKQQIPPLRFASVGMTNPRERGVVS